MRAAIVLAAGASRRFGMHPKQLAVRRGRCLLGHAIARARAGMRGRVLVTVGHQRARIAAVARRFGRVTLVRVPGARPGLADSLAAARAVLRPIERELLILLADMPDAAPPSRLRLRAGEGAVRPAWRGRPGHPVLVRRTLLDRLPLTGDAGLGPALRARLMPGRRGSCFDIDRLRDLHR